MLYLLEDDRSEASCGVSSDNSSHYATLNISDGVYLMLSSYSSQKKQKYLFPDTLAHMIITQYFGSTRDRDVARPQF